VFVERELFILKKIVTLDHSEASLLIAESIVDIVRAKKDACLGLATGGSVELVYANLVKFFEKGEVSFSGVTTANLDEYIGLPPSHPQSYRQYMNHNFFDLVDIDKANTYIPQGMEVPEVMLADFQKTLASRPRDFQLLGIGSNGHIGFNEPAAYFEANAHIVSLDERTRKDNARFFGSIDEVPRQAVTMGVGDIMKASKIMLLVRGENKKEALHELLSHDRVDPRIPCTILKCHSDVTVVFPKELAS